MQTLTFFKAIASVMSSCFSKIQISWISLVKKRQKGFHRISCPVEGKPAPYIEWSKEGESVDHTWDRYKVQYTKGAVISNSQQKLKMFMQLWIDHEILKAKICQFFYSHYLKGQSREIFNNFF